MYNASHPTPPPWQACFPAAASVAFLLYLGGMAPSSMQLNSIIKVSRWAAGTDAWACADSKHCQDSEGAKT